MRTRTDGRQGPFLATHGGNPTCALNTAAAMLCADTNKVSLGSLALGRFDQHKLLSEAVKANKGLHR